MGLTQSSNIIMKRRVTYINVLAEKNGYLQNNNKTWDSENFMRGS